MRYFLNYIRFLGIRFTTTNIHREWTLGIQPVGDHEYVDCIIDITAKIYINSHFHYVQISNTKFKD